MLCENYDSKLQAFVGHSSNYLETKIFSNKNIVNEVVRLKFDKENKLDF